MATKEFKNPSNRNNPSNKKNKVDKLRYAEYYDQQDKLDELHAKSCEGKIFDNLMGLICSKANILMAYRSIKSNKGSKTAGTDGLTIEDVERLTPDELVEEIRRRLTYYRPKAVKRVEIPKPNGKTRPLGIPCIWDRLIQQCILQILEPIAEAKFSDNSYGFRPLRSAEHAIAAEMKLINLSHLHYVVEVDIKSFFDEVCHTKLMRQLWTMGIRDKKLLCVIKAILKAPIKMPDGKTVHPQKGTPQGGILSPLLANIVLNELDQWIDGQWVKWPNNMGQKAQYNNRGNTYKVMRKTNLKEMHIVRYADDIRILCPTRSQADKAMMAVKLYLNDRLKLQCSDEKTRVVNLKRQYSEFLGFKIKAQPKGNKRVVKSHMCDKAKARTKDKLKKQVIAIQHPPKGSNVVAEILKYNAMVRGLHNYFSKATEVNVDFKEIAFEVERVIHNRLRSMIVTKGMIDKKSMDYKTYGKSKMTKFVNGQWILPVGYVQTKNPMCKEKGTNKYTAEGRRKIHDKLAIANKWIMDDMARNPIPNRSAQYNDNRISLFSAQYGKCAVTGTEFANPSEVHCHHKKPRKNGGGDEYKNLCLVRDDVHRLIHATIPETINGYLDNLKLNSEQLKKINKLRQMACCEPI